MRVPQNHIAKLPATLLDIVEIHQAYFRLWTFCLESSFIKFSLWLADEYNLSLVQLFLSQSDAP